MSLGKPQAKSDGVDGATGQTASPSGGNTSSSLAAGGGTFGAVGAANLILQN